jgi:homocysteine S-methyltransferase
MVSMEANRAVSGEKCMNLKERLARRETLVMDGAMGTEILYRGVDTALPLWSAEALLSRPDVVQDIHRDYIAAGAEIIITNTFRTTRRAFAKAGRADEAHCAAVLACQLVQWAIQEAGSEYVVYIAGSMAPLEDCYSPELTPSMQDLLREHLAYAQDLKMGGVDFLLLETMITLRETLAAMQAAAQLEMPFAVSFCTNEEGQLLGGEPLEQVMKEVEKYDPLFVGVNCVSPALATKTLYLLKSITSRPLSVYAQGAGMPSEDQGWLFIEENNQKHYMRHVQDWMGAGAQIIGGCCGTSPTYIENVARLTTS